MTLEELRRLVERAAKRRPHLTSRLEKAAFLVLLRPIQQLHENVWRVGSEDGLRFYTVKRGQCECSDYVRHGANHPCKHRLALSLRRALEESTRASRHPGARGELSEVGELCGFARRHEDVRNKRGGDIVT
jgi:hypothetical protein